MNASYPAMAHTNERFISCDGHQLYCLQGAGCRCRSRGHALYRDASQTTYVLGPPPSRGGDLKLEGGVNVSLSIYGVVQYMEHLFGLASECRR